MPSAREEYDASMKKTREILDAGVKSDGSPLTRAERQVMQGALRFSYEDTVVMGLGRSTPEQDLQMGLLEEDAGAIDRERERRDEVRDETPHTRRHFGNTQADIAAGFRAEDEAVEEPDSPGINGPFTETMIQRQIAYERSLEAQASKAARGADEPIRTEPVSDDDVSDRFLELVDEVMEEE